MQDLFLTNNSDITFLDKIKDSLNRCLSFSFSVSFIKKAGLILFEKEIENALKRGAQGRIITSTYQNFTDIASLETMLAWSNKYSNFECHLDFNCFGENGFHSKGYLFDFGDSNEFIVGSSNITRFALLKNVEWNVSLTNNEKFNSAEKAYIEFYDLWNKTLKINKDLIKKYQMQLDYAIEKWDMDYFDTTLSVIRPNVMQKKALKELRRLRDMGQKRALVVAATGSGKTYLAAFDAKNYDAKRVLFVVHRDKILVDAKESFEKVFGPEKTYGLYVGNKKDLDCDFVFASNKMLSQNLDMFDKNEFDYIVIDECHHAAASTYQKIMQYFTPGFYLGITATPERMDNQDVFDLFDKNVPYELRLRDAIINELVVPFHYYGIRDTLADYGFKEDDKISSQIASNINVDFIVGEIEKHRPSGKLKALAFCTRTSHCMAMAEQFAEHGYHAIALTGKDDLGTRIKAFNDLQDEKNPLEIICAIDILNEGIDIPAVNMVLFLRPTESSTIFLQQLGRGLRKYQDKPYVTVLDFIGNNYDRSVQIALALGSLTKTTQIEKRLLIDLLKNNFQDIGIPGVIIDIDPLSREEVINYIAKTNFNRRDFLIKDYENFKQYLKSEGYPSHMDFYNSDCAPDLIRIMKANLGGKNYSYYNFLKKIGEESIPYFTDEQEKIINKVSDLLPLVRADEYLIVKQLMEKHYININELVGYNSKVNTDTLNNALYLLKNNSKLDLIYDEKIFNASFIEYMDDLLTYGLQRYEDEFGEFDGRFKLYKNYYKEQILRVMCENSKNFMKGTKFYDNGDTIVFIGLKKDKEKAERMSYKDKFINSKIFQWESENNTSFDSSTGKKILSTKKVYLFVRKMDDEDGITLPFTYFGTGTFENARKSYVHDETKNVNYPTLLLDIRLDKEVNKEYWFDFEIKEEE